MSQERVRPADRRTSLLARDSTRHAANCDSSPKASCLACVSVDGRDANAPSNSRSSLNSGVV